MTNPAQSRADAVRAALIEHVGQELHGHKPRVAGAQHQVDSTHPVPARPSLTNHRLGRWVAASFALILVGGIASAALLIAGNSIQAIGPDQAAATPRPAATSQTPEAPAPPKEGDAALWQLIDAESVDADSTSLKLSVTRLGCAGGETGDVLEPRVTYEATRIVIQVDVEPLAVGTAHTCQGNNSVPITLELAEPIGERSLVDGGCSEIADTTSTVCSDPTRWG